MIHEIIGPQALTWDSFRTGRTDHFVASTSVTRLMLLRWSASAWTCHRKSLFNSE